MTPETKPNFTSDGQYKQSSRAALKVKKNNTFNVVLVLFNNRTIIFYLFLFTYFFIH